MRANSWLYHYYMVQSKLQYGMQFEAQTSPRVPSTGPASQAVAPPPPTVSVYAYHHEQSPHGGGHRQQDAYAPADHHQQQHQQHQQEPMHNYHHQQQQPQQQLPDGYFRYAAAPVPAALATATGTAVTAAKRRRGLEPEPVDYSVHSPEQTPPLKTEADGGHSVASDSPPTPPMGGDSGGGGGGGGGMGGCATALSSTSLPSVTSLGRSRALVKAAMDPGDLMMETWNPSPPWSDCCSSGAGALQKVPDVDMLGGAYCGQPTPPTPGSGGSYHPSSSSSSGGAPAAAAQQRHPDEVPNADLRHPLQHHQHHHHQHHHHQPSTFTFDWPGEQYVPNVHHEVLVEPAPHYLVPFPPWPHAADHHRLFPLQPPPPGSLNRPSLIVRVDQDAAADTSVQGNWNFTINLNIIFQFNVRVHDKK